MNLIAEQPYFKVQRKVNSTEQINVEYERLLYLYDDKLITKYREFPISDVLDMSYRVVGGQGGMLYLHTIKGVFTYTVKTTPQPFIDAFKEHIKKQR